MIEDYSCGIVPLQKTEQGIEVLLIFHKGGRHWSFPKGHKDPGETDLQAAFRELKEETGLEIEKCFSDIAYLETYTFYKLHEKVRKTVTYFPAFVKGTLSIQPEEIEEARWLPIEKALNQLTFEETKEICRKVQALVR